MSARRPGARICYEAAMPGKVCMDDSCTCDHGLALRAAAAGVCPYFFSGTCSHSHCKLKHSRKELLPLRDVCALAATSTCPQGSRCPKDHDLAQLVRAYKVCVNHVALSGCRRADCPYPHVPRHRLAFVAAGGSISDATAKTSGGDDPRGAGAGKFFTRAQIFFLIAYLALNAFGFPSGTMWTLLTIYAVVINGIALFAFTKDKLAAQDKGWRISEAELHLVALLGGGVGAFLGQRLAKHKTSKQSFMRVNIVSFAIHVLALGYLAYCVW